MACFGTQQDFAEGGEFEVNVEKLICLNWET